MFDSFEIDLLSGESPGVKRLFQMICPIIDILNTGKILICDELESGLHESVINQIVHLFHHHQKDKFAHQTDRTHADAQFIDISKDLVADGTAPMNRKR